MDQHALCEQGSASSTKRDFVNELLSIGEPFSQLREEKWISMKNRGLAAFAKAHWNTFVRRTNRGIPQKYRWDSWKVALRFDVYAGTLAPKYETFANTTNEYTSIIQIDVPRTFPELKVFDVEAQQQLSRILHAYANYSPEVGYCQGMNFVAGESTSYSRKLLSVPWLCTLPSESVSNTCEIYDDYEGNYHLTTGLLLLVSGFNEVESYVAFVGLMREFGLAEFYMPSFPLIQKYIQAFEALTDDMWPDLHRHFQQEEISVAVFLHQWFLTMFVIILPLRTVVALWDYMLYNGLSSVLAVSLGLQYLLAPQMKQLKFEGIMSFLKNIKDADSKDDIRVGRIIVNQAYRITTTRGCLDSFILAQQAISLTNLPSFEAVGSGDATKRTASSAGRSKPNPLAAIVSQLGLSESPRDEM
ncbi:GTPase activator protein, putative [Babesia bigemina]|uniref:GTPase activator protein, putative n=1 Tax=Babesia bigemina TaxID=5866 RepID=A0A061DC27_BABBI|nr:GTPase activator protein, putative [Babesia bigemina]CDR97562.1 GTPase activator protein, putative [Babesia bigemina]|eukprot:XP_012769748.1 GTPase activator protein, putative [Babesia bigemina]